MLINNLFPQRNFCFLSIVDIFYIITQKGIGSWILSIMKVRLYRNVIFATELRYNGMLFSLLIHVTTECYFRYWFTLERNVIFATDSRYNEMLFSLLIHVITECYFRYWFTL